MKVLFQIKRQRDISSETEDYNLVDDPLNFQFLLLKIHRLHDVLAGPFISNCVLVHTEKHKNIPDF